MRRTIRFLFVIALIAVFLIGGNVSAGEFAKVGTVGTQFLKIPVGARGAAMGHAFSSLSDDGTAMFWNPAGLMKIEKTTVSLERINWLADISYDAIMISHKLQPSLALGVFVTSLNSGDIEVTTVEQPQGTGSYFNVTDMMIGVSAATQLTNKFTLGANIKYIREDLDGEVAGAYSVDVGTMYDTRWKTVRLSMAIRNFGPEIQLDGNYYDFDNGTQQEEPTEFLEYHYPMTFKLGLAIDPVLTETHRFTLVGELEHPNDNLERYNLGGEYGFQNMFFLRGGYTFRHDTLGLSSGLGAKWKGFGIDYAFSDYGILDEVHRFNVNFSF